MPLPCTAPPPTISWGVWFRKLDFPPSETRGIQSLELDGDINISAWVRSWKAPEFNAVLFSSASLANVSIHHQSRISLLQKTYVLPSPFPSRWKSSLVCCRSLSISLTLTSLLEMLLCCRSQEDEALGFLLPGLWLFSLVLYQGVTSQTPQLSRNLAPTEVFGSKT